MKKLFPIVAILLLFFGCDSEKVVKLDFFTDKQIYTSNEYITLTIKNVGEKTIYFVICNQNPYFYRQKKIDSLWVSQPFACFWDGGTSGLSPDSSIVYNAITINDTGTFRFALPFGEREFHENATAYTNEFTIR